MFMKKSAKEILDALNQTNQEVQALLAKSGIMQKDGGMPAPEGDEGQEPAPEGMEGQEPEGAPAPEGDEGQEGAPEGTEGQEGGEDHQAALMQQVKEMPDEELDHMLEVMMAEKEARSASQGAPDQGQPQPQPAPEPAEKSYGADLAKSMSAMAQAVQSLTKEVQTLKTASKPAVKVTSKPAATSVKVLEKSAPQPKRLAKSETVQFLLGQVRAKNPLVTSTHIAQVNNIHDDESLAQWQDRMALEGLKFPEQR
jgi:hypothetical protein